MRLLLSLAEVQDRLIELGYLSGEADGQCGMDTARAVELFQKANGLSVTGTVNRATLSKLFSDDAAMDEIVSAQNRLIELGYLSGKADGIWGGQSAQALKHFQKINSLTQNGELDKDTIPSQLRIYITIICYSRYITLINCQM